MTQAKKPRSKIGKLRDHVRITTGSRIATAEQIALHLSRALETANRSTSFLGKAALLDAILHVKRDSDILLSDLKADFEEIEIVVV
jgi:hypothetical protein